MQGIYTGDGSTYRTINLGVTPKLLLIGRDDWNNSRGLVFLARGGTTTNLLITAGGFVVRYTTEGTGVGNREILPVVNENGDAYQYIAIY